MVTQIASGNQKFSSNRYNDVGLYEISTLVPKDTQMLVGDYYSVISQAGEYLELDGQKLEGLELFNEEGEYQVEVYLPECGYIGNFTINVIGCQEYLADQEKPHLTDSTYCIHRGITVELPPLSQYEYYYQQKLVEEPSLFFNDLESHSIYAYHKKCGVQDSATYEGIDCITQEESSCFYIPNIFSPNGDGVNDVFDIQGECEVVTYNLQIFDRWGNQIYTSTSINERWDGRFNDQQTLSGVYVYHLQVEFIKDKQVFSETKTGTVTILGGKN